MWQRPQDLLKTLFLTRECIQANGAYSELRACCVDVESSEGGYRGRLLVLLLCCFGQGCLVKRADFTGPLYRSSAQVSITIDAPHAGCCVGCMASPVGCANFPGFCMRICKNLHS